MKKLRKVIIIFASLGLCSAHWTQAQVIQFDMSGLDGVTEDPWFEGGLAQGVSLDRELTRNDLTPVARTGQFASTGWNATDNFDWDAHFVNFIISPEPGWQFELDRFDFLQTASFSAPGTIRVAYGVDQAPEQMSYVEFPTELDEVSRTVTLGAMEVIAGQEFEVRIYAYGSERPPGGPSSDAGAVRFGAMSVEGAVIPEPAAYPAIAGLAMLGGALYLRFRKKKGKDASR